MVAAEGHQAATAATAESEAAARRASGAEVTVQSLNATLKTIRERERKALEHSAAGEAQVAELRAENEAYTKRAADRQAELDKTIRTATVCQARIDEEWKGQAECAKALKDKADSGARVKSLRERIEAAEAEAAAARSEAVGKNETEAALADCKVARRTALDESARLAAAAPRLKEAARGAQEGAQSALAKEGVAVEAARLSKEQYELCTKESKKAAATRAQLEATLAEKTDKEAACTAELATHSAFLVDSDGARTGVPTSMARRQLKGVLHILSSDWTRLSASIANVYAFFRAPAALASRPPLPPLAMAPISARAVYVWALMLMMLLWLWLQLRAAKLQRARDVELIMRAQERLQTMQQVLESLDAESTKIALKALSFEDDGPSAKRQEKATATTK